MTRRLHRVMPWAAALALVAGCGSSLGGSSPTGSAGTRVYGNSEFKITVPVGFKQGTTVSGGGGASGTVFTTADNRASLSVHAYPHSTQGIDQTLAAERLSDSVESGNGAVRQLRSEVRSLTVAGARQAKELTQTFVNAHGTQRLAELLVLTPAGTLIDATATASARAGGTDPASVVGSLKLGAS